jgi:hypothetical protein
MMDVYEYTGNNPASVDEYAIFIRRQMYAAYVETFSGVTFLVTDYTVHSTNFRYISRKV